MTKTKKSGQLVVPGEKLGVIEEFLSGPGTYVEDGGVHSKVIGRVLLDFANRSVSVFPLVRGVCVPQIGKNVIGDVQNLQSSMATIRIVKIGKKFLSSFFTGILHISDISFGYVESMLDACRIGDVIRAKVISDKNRTYHLSTKSENLGVIYAFCSQCGNLLILNKGRMECHNCRNVEKRKTASDYGKGII